MQSNFTRFVSPTELQQELLIYSDGMGFQDLPEFHIQRSNFNNYLIMYTIYGELICFQEGRKLSVLPGEAVLLDLHKSHRYYFRENLPSRIAWTHINGTPSHEIVQKLQEVHPFPVKIQSLEILEKLLTLFEISNRPSPDIFKQSECLYQLLLIFLNTLWEPHTPSNETRYREFRKTIWDVIQHRLGDQITLADLAASVSLSKYHFARTFKEAFGVSAMEFVTEERIRQAKYLLRSTTQSVHEIAESLGFSTPGYFGKVFFQHCGCTPSKYRDSPDISL